MKYTRPHLHGITGQHIADCNVGSGATGGGGAINCVIGNSAVYDNNSQTACFGGNSAVAEYPCAYGNGDSGAITWPCNGGGSAVGNTYASGTCYAGTGA